MVGLSGHFTQGPNFREMESPTLWKGPVHQRWPISWPWFWYQKKHIPQNMELIHFCPSRSFASTNPVWQNPRPNALRQRLSFNNYRKQDSRYWDTNLEAPVKEFICPKVWMGQSLGSYHDGRNQHQTATLWLFNVANWEVGPQMCKLGSQQTTTRWSNICIYFIYACVYI
jgi:hypothetical protein